VWLSYIILKFVYLHYYGIYHFRRLNKRSAIGDVCGGDNGLASSKYQGAEGNGRNTPIGGRAKENTLVQTKNSADNDNVSIQNVQFFESAEINANINYQRKPAYDNKNYNIHDFNGFS